MGVEKNVIFLILNNADLFDKEKSVMTWDMTNLSESGIQFVLETRK